MALHESDEGVIVPRLPVRRRRSHDDLAQPVLEQQPSMRGARQRLRREMRRRPRAREPLLTQRPDAATVVADLARECDDANVPVRIGTSIDEHVAQLEDGGWTQAVMPVKGDTDD